MPSLAVFNYGLNDHARAFWKSGFRVDMGRYQINDFVLIKPNDHTFRTLDSLNHHAPIKAITRTPRIAEGR
jgi:hypothetical protein